LFGVPRLRGKNNVRQPDRLKAELQTFHRAEADGTDITIPKGLHHSAQGCEHPPSLRYGAASELPWVNHRKGNNPESVVSTHDSLLPTNDTTPLGLENHFSINPG
jgi:hypothetical protein